MSHTIGILLWNACLASGLAVVVFLAQRSEYLRIRPQVCHALWLLVLLKLVTPPLFSIPVSADSMPWHQDDRAEIPVFRVDQAIVRAEALAADAQNDPSVVAPWVRTILSPRTVVAMTTLGSLALLIGCFSRVRQIERFVRHAEPAPEWMQQFAHEAAQRFFTRREPSVRVVNGTLSPFLWASRSGTLIVLPQSLMTELEPAGVRLIIQHEMSHYVRRDHWTNGFASAIAILFWWNPIVWWARRELRALQESCCDAMVLSQDISQRVRYAETLLKAVDFVASNGATCPSPATTFGSCETLKRRVEMIVSHKPMPINSRWTRASVLAFGLVVIPFGMTNAQDYDAVQKRLGKAVSKGEINLEQAQVMMEALHRSAHRDHTHAHHREDVNRRINEIKELVDRGELSHEDGTRLVEETERDFSDAREHAAAHEKHEAIEHRILKIRELIEHGKISREDGERKIEETRRALEKAEHQAEPRRLHERIERRISKIKELIDRGEVSHEDGERMIEATRRRLEKATHHDDDNHRRHEQVERRISEIHELIENGELSREKGERMIESTRWALSVLSDDESANRKRKYAELERKIKLALREGKLSYADAEEKLIDIRRDLFGDRTHDERLEERERRYKQLEREIDIAIQEGKLSPEEAEQRLMTVRRKLFQD